MNTPKIASAEVAVELYYGTIALYTDGIRRLFPGASAKYKKMKRLGLCTVK